jgi:hypothetical protein
MLAPKLRVMLREVDGVPLAGDDESGASRSIGVDAMASRKKGQSSLYNADLSFENVWRVSGMRATLEARRARSIGALVRCASVVVLKCKVGR